MIDNQKDKLVLRLQEGYQVIDFKSLIYCKSDKGYTSFYLSDGKSYMTSKPIKKFEGQLPVKNFIRTHQSYIVNMAFVDKNGYIFLNLVKKYQQIHVEKMNLFRGY